MRMREVFEDESNTLLVPAIFSAVSWGPSGFVLPNNMCHVLLDPLQYITAVLHLPAMAPKLAGKRKRDQPGAVHWWTDKNAQDLEACYKKELALFLKGYYVDPEHWNQRKYLYFQRNYAEVPGLLSRCNQVVEDINAMVDARLSKILSDAPADWEGLLEGEEVLGPFLLREPEESRGFLRLPRPQATLGFGTKSPQKELPPALRAKVEHALCEWWRSDIRPWVANAEQTCHAATFARLLWDGCADHVEIKVSGRPAQSALHVLMPEAEPVESLADLVDERVIMKWQERTGRDEEFYGSWLLEITDGHIRLRVNETIRELVEIKCPPNADPEKLRKIKELEQSIFQSRGWMQRHQFKEMIRLKTECAGMTEQEGRRVRNKMQSFGPCKRFASCNGGLEEGSDEEYLDADATCRVLPAPEDQMLLRHMCSCEAQVTVTLSWIRLWDCELRVEVVGRVPKGYKRPYPLARFGQKTQRGFRE